MNNISWSRKGNVYWSSCCSLLPLRFFQPNSSPPGLGKKNKHITHPYRRKKPIKIVTDLIHCCVHPLNYSHSRVSSQTEIIYLLPEGIFSSILWWCTKVLIVLHDTVWSKHKGLFRFSKNIRNEKRINISDWKLFIEGESSSFCPFTKLDDKGFIWLLAVKHWTNYRMEILLQTKKK